MGTRPRLAVVKAHEINVNINDKKLQRVHSCKQLVVIVNESLNWHEKVCNIQKESTSRSIYA